MYILKNVKIKNNVSNEEALSLALKKFNINKKDLISYKISKKSLDARNKANIFWNYSFTVDLKKKYNLEQAKDLSLEKVENNFKSNFSPVIIRSGPAGIFCSLTFLKYGIKPIIIEQGSCVEKRKQDIENFAKNKVLNPKSNIQFGEGGAGTFSDGKLNTSSNSKYITEVLETFVKFGAPEEILYLSKPHIGTNYLFTVMQNIRKYVIENGGQYFFDEEFLDFSYLPNNLIEVVTSKNKFKTNHLILATGHSSYNTYKILEKHNVKMSPKNFAIGVRIEHLANDISFAQYGKDFAKYPTADYKLVFQDKQTGRSCFSFCMCPGGFVMPSTSDEFSIVTNGMSNFERNNINSNSALIVNVTPQDFEQANIFSGIDFIRSIEQKAYKMAGSNYNAPFCFVKDLKIPTSNITSKVEPTYPGVTHTDLEKLFPQFVTQTLKNAIIHFDTKIQGFANPNAILTAPETRTSSPVTIHRDENFMSSAKGVYPIGEGAGFSGGITTSAIDGIKAGLSIIENG